MTIFWGLMIPFIGTTLGALCVLFIKNELKPVIQKSLLGFAAGVMVAASVWSLLIPAMEMSDYLGQLAFLPAAVGFLVGIVFLLALDRLIPHLHLGSEESEGPKASLKKSTMLILAVTIHNIPEGISGGAVFAGLLMNNSKVTLAGAFALSIGIAIQNVHLILLLFRFLSLRLSLLEDGTLEYHIQVLRQAREVPQILLLHNQALQGLRRM